MNMVKCILHICYITDSKGPVVPLNVIYISIILSFVYGYILGRIRIANGDLSCLVCRHDEFNIDIMLLNISLLCIYINNRGRVPIPNSLCLIYSK